VSVGRIGGSIKDRNRAILREHHLAPDGMLIFRDVFVTAATSTFNSSHIHWPEAVKLKKCPSMAKLLTKETRRPGGMSGFTRQSPLPSM
jgi:hypothetical protein